MLLPTDDEMRGAFESLVCRCGSHVGIFRRRPARSRIIEKERITHGSQNRYQDESLLRTPEAC